MRISFQCQLALTMMLSLLIGGCVTLTPLDVAFNDRNKAEIFHLLQTEENSQLKKSQLLSRSIEMLRMSTGDASALNFYSQLAKDLVKNGADMYGDLYSLIVNAGSSGMAIDVLHDVGFDLNTREKLFGQTLAHTATFFGSKEAIEKLVRYGADLNIKDGRGRTPLGQAVADWGDDRSDLDYANAEVAEKTKRHLAAAYERMTKVLINNGANINGRFGEDGRTPYLQAALQHRGDIMSYLVSVGADKNLRNTSGLDSQAYWKMGEENIRFKEGRRQEELAKSKATSDLMGKIATGVVTAGVVSNISIPAESKVKILGAVATDLATSGKTNAVANLSNNQSSVSGAIPDNKYTQGGTKSSTPEARTTQGAKDCTNYLNENAGVASETEGMAKWRREAAASNAKNRALGVPDCNFSKSSGPSPGVSR